MSNVIFRPGLRFGSYPQNKDCEYNDFEKNAAVFCEKIRQKLSGNKFNQNDVIKKIEQNKIILEYGEREFTILLRKE
jgi:hypothetical protein